MKLYRLHAEEAIGRPLDKSRAQHNILKHDREPPNLYEWHFSDRYPRFPQRGISKWGLEELK